MGSMSLSLNGHAVQTALTAYQTTVTALQELWNGAGTTSLQEYTQALHGISIHINKNACDEGRCAHDRLLLVAWLI